MSHFKNDTAIVNQDITILLHIKNNYDANIFKIFRQVKRNSLELMIQNKRVIKLVSNETICAIRVTQRKITTRLWSLARYESLH